MNKQVFINYLKERQYASETIASSIKGLERFSLWLTKENIPPEQVQKTDTLAYIKYCQKQGLQQRSIERYLNTLKLYYNALLENSIIAHHPIDLIKLQGIKRKSIYYILEPHQLHELYNNYPATDLKGRRDKAMLGLFVYQGMTTTELCKLEVKDIQLREGKINVPGGKRSESRTLQLEAHQVLDLYDYILQVRAELIKKTGIQTDKLIINLLAGKQTTNAVHRLMKQLKPINKQVVNAQQIRASVIVKWLRIHNLREAQYKAGHRYISSTESFMQNEMQGLQEEIDRYHPLA